MKTNIRIQFWSILLVFLMVFGVGNAWGTGVASLPLDYEFVYGTTNSFDILYPGITKTGLGSDYAIANSPYMLKFDNTNDNIIIQTDYPAASIIIGVKMIGGGNTSYFQISGSTDGSSYTNIEKLTISGSSGSQKNCTTSVSISNTYRYFKLNFEKGSNVGLGVIKIAKGTPASAYKVTFHPGTGTCLTDDLTEESAGDGVTLPSATTSCTGDGWDFYGWSTTQVSSETSTVPTIVGKAGDKYYPTSATDLYAVYAKGEYTKITDDSQIGEGKYIIAADYDDAIHVMTSKYFTDDEDIYMKEKIVTESASGKIHIRSIEASWLYNITGSNDAYFIQDVIYSKYIDTYYVDWYYRDKDASDHYTIDFSGGTCFIKNNYGSCDYPYLVYFADGDFGTVGSKWAGMMLYKETTTPSYYSNPSCCDKEVSVSESGSSHITSMAFSESSVATCGDAASRTITITVTPASGYSLFGTTKPVFTKTSGTVTATIGSVTDNGDGTFSYECTFNSNDNGAGTFSISPGQFTNYRTVCCTPLGEIDGEVNITTDGCDPGEIKVTWKMEATTGIASQTLKVYDENVDEVTAKRITSITASTSNQTKTISGLDPCKDYFVTIENVSSGGSYCAAGAPWTSDVVTTLGYTYTVNATNCQLKSTSDPVPDDMCDGDVLVYYEATGGSTLPDAITVTNAGDENVGWAWDSSDGSLMIDADAVTGNVTVTIFASCPDYSFHYGNDGDDASLWTITCFEKVKPLDATDHEWKLEDFTIPSKTDFYVGYQGSFKGSDNLGIGGASSATKAWTATPTYSTDHWDGAMILAPNDGYTYGSYAVGQATGATGTITIYDDSNSDNLFAEFEPDGYGISYSTSSFAFGDATSHVRETEVVTLPNVSTTYAIGLATATEGTYVKCAHSKSSDEAISAIGISNKINGKKRILFNPVKSSDDYTTSDAKIAIWDATNSAFYDFMTDTDDDGILEAEVPMSCVKINIVRLNSNTTKSELTNSASTYAAAWAKKWNQSSDITLGDLLEQVNFDGWCSGDGCKESMTTTTIHPTTGQTGKFRMIDNDKNQNWNVRFVPYYKLSYDANGGSGSTAAATRDSESSTQTVTVASNGFTAPTGYSFAGWATSDSRADAGTVDYAAGDSYTLNGDATLYAVWSANTISLTLSKNNNDASGSSDGSASVKYDGTALTSISHASRTGYSIEGYYGELGCTTKVLKDDGTFADDDVSGFIDGGKWNNATTPTTLYAKWTANSYTVTLDNNDATSGSQQTVSATYASAMPLKTTADGTPAVAALSRTGYTFTGWWDATNGGNQYYSYDGSSISSARNWDKASNTTLKAQWSVNNYTLTWSWDGGSTSSTTHTAAGSVAYGTTLVYPANNTMSKTGHTFTGWSSTPSTMPAANTTITAQWSVNNYNVAVLANSNVEITANTTITEGNNANVNYGTTVTLNCSSINSGMTWGGWKVYKADDASTTVTVSGTGNGATFTMPAYAVKVEAFIYSAGIAWCDPEIEFDGDIYLTSAKGVYVHSTEDADNLLNIASTDLGSATSMEIAYLDADDSDAEKDKDESLFRLYNSTASAAIDASSSTIDVSASRTFNTDYSIKYTPDDDGVINNYKLQLKLFKGEKELKTVTKAIYGRSLPDEFAIVFKNTNTDKWYTLPSNLASTQAAQERIGLNKAIEVAVDNTTTPTKVLLAPNTRIYKGTGRNNAANNINGIRFTNDGSHWLQTSGTETKLWLSNTNSDNNQVFYLKSTDFNTYVLAMDPSHNPTKKLGVYTQSTEDYIGYAASIHSNIYILPIEESPVELMTDATDWMDDIIQMTAEGVSDVSATQIVAVNEDGSVETGSTEFSTPATNTYFVDFDGGIDFTTLTGDKLTLKWLDESDNLVGLSWIDVPSIILAGSNDEWSDFASAPTLADYVVLSKPMEIDVVGAQAKRIEIDQSGSNIGSIEIPAGKELIVAETVRKFNGSSFGATGESDLVINSASYTDDGDDTNDGLGGLVMGDHDGTNKATVYFATLSHGTSGSTASVSQYVGTPFCDESTISYDWYNSWVYGITYDGSGNIGWTRINGDQGMTPFKGYAVISADPAGHVYEMGGSLNPTANRTMDGLNWQSGTGTNPNNENLLANGWMAPIKIKAFKAEDFVKTDASIYIFNSGSPDDYDEIGASYGSGAGQYQTYPINIAEATDVIPAMQSFSVYTNASGGSSVTLDYKRLVYDPAVAGTTPVPNRAPLATKNADEANKLKLFVKAESGYGDMLYMWEREDFTDYFENGWDGRKVFGETTAPQLYAVTPDGNMAVNCVPTFEGVVMGFKAGDNENFYTFTFECDDEAEALYLVDTDNNAYTRVLSTNSYWFTTSDKEAHNRFILTHNAPGSTTGIDNTGSVQGTKAYKVIMHDKMYIIYGQEMYDATGKRVNEIK